ncbi:hypothetical protein WJX84_005492 [Apatococcus fuscideae]|uniref:Uncharacterized protein n=1 Tax=Apatococcus fuscideae TaxID=2026836 RepID=A0AAW1SPE1_9CHLO
MAGFRAAILCLAAFALSSSVAASSAEFTGADQFRVNHGFACQACVGLANATSAIAAFPRLQQQLGTNLDQHVCAKLSTDQAVQCREDVESLVPALLPWLAKLDTASTCQKANLCGPEAAAVEVFAAAAADRRDGHSTVANNNGLPCPMCKFLLTEVLGLLENENTENELLAQAHEACETMSAAERDMCNSRVDLYGRLAFLLIRDISPSGVCHLAQSCPPDDEFPGQLTIPQPLAASLAALARPDLIARSNDGQCDTCKEIVTEAARMLANPQIQQQLLADAQQACEIFKTLKDQCVSYVEVYGPLAIQDAQPWGRQGVFSNEGALLQPLRPVVSQAAGVEAALQERKAIDQIPEQKVRRRRYKVRHGPSRYKGVRKLNEQWESRIAVSDGKQQALGTYPTEQEAAQAFDRAAIVLKRASGLLNFPVATYSKEIDQLHTLSFEEFAAQNKEASRLRYERKQTSRYKGVSKRVTGVWTARMILKGRIVNLGTHTSEQSAARAFDIAAINQNRPESDLNFPLSSYKDQLEKLRSQTLEEIQAQLLVRFRVGVEATSRFNGVSRSPTSQTPSFRSRIFVDAKEICLGQYKTEVEAARAFDKAIICHGREDITLNFDWSPQEVAVLRSQDFAQLCEQLKDEARQRHNPKTSRYRGVSRREGREDAQWVAFIQQDKRKYYLGCWTHEEDAARAYDKAALCTKAWENFCKREDLVMAGNCQVTGKVFKTNFPVEDRSKLTSLQATTAILFPDLHLRAILVTNSCCWTLLSQKRKQCQREANK